MENHHPSLLNLAYFFQGKSMEELRQSLVYTTLELEQTRGAAQEELRKRDDELLNLKDLLNKTIIERDEAQEKFQRLFLEKLIYQQQQQQTAPVSGISSIEDEQRRGGGIDSNIGLSSSDCEESIVSSPQPESIMIEKTLPLPLPEKGKLLEAVMKAGPLLQTLLLAGPLPQWRHPPPPLESFEIPPVTIPSPTPTPQQQQDSFFADTNNTSCSPQCGRLISRKRMFCDIGAGSDSSPTDNKYQRVLLH